MFDYQQDVRLLHNSLLSAAHRNSDNLFDCANVNDAVHIIYNSIKLIIHNSLKKAKNEKEKVDILLNCNQRLHAALFFTTLRCHDIKSEAANEFYDSILYNWPSISLKFYVELSYKCDWSEYFIMCALQLPSEALFRVLKIIFETPFEDDVECYSKHLILQTLIFKLYELSCCEQILYPFNFDFVVESTLSGKEKSLGEPEDKNNQITQSCDKSNEESCKISQNSDTIMYKYNDADQKSDVSDNTNGIPREENGNSIVIASNVTESQDENSEEENEYFTPYSYEISDDENETTHVDKNDLLIFKELCYDIYDNIALKLEKSSEVGVLKILLHAVKVLSKFLVVVLKRDDTTIFSFQNYIKLFKDYLSMDANKEKIKIQLKKCSVVFERHAHATVSWNVCLNYLIFLTEHYIEVALPNICSNLLGDLFYKNIVSVVGSLNNLNSPFLISSEHISLLCKIIQFEFEGSSHAAKILLASPTILKENNVLTVLGKNFLTIDLPQTYTSLIDCIVSVDYPEVKQNLLKILYSCLQMHGPDMYNTIIGYILDNYGITEEFQLPDWKNQLHGFTYQTPTQEEIEKKIPPLLIQNPKSTLKYLIDEALLQGPEGEIFIQILKHFKNACIYMKKCGPVCILHEILNGYLNEPKLEVYASKNMVTVYRFLMKVHSETPILYPCKFFSECLIPNLHPDYDRIGLLLDCIYVLIPSLLSDDSIFRNSAFFCDLLTQFGILTNYYIVKNNGEMKSLIIPILKELEIHQQKSKEINEKEKLKLWSTFKDFNEMTCVYFEAFLPEDIDLVSREAVWIQCCKNEDVSNFETKFHIENLTYTSLVNTLCEVLPHLTKEEWQSCFNLVKLCCTNHKVRDEIICSNNPFQLCEPELDTYAVVLSVITSLHFILNNNTDGLLYLSSCFSNFLKDMYQTETAHVHFLLSIALEFCHLISSISPDLMHVYHATLFEMKKEMGSRFPDSVQNDCNKLLNHVITCIPNLCQGLE